MNLMLAPLSLYTIFKNCKRAPNGEEIAGSWLVWVVAEMINQLIMLYILEQMNDNFNENIDQ